MSLPDKTSNDANRPSLPQPAEAGRERLEGWLKEDRSVNVYRWETWHSRLRGKSRFEAIKYLAERDGPFCCGCNEVLLDTHNGVDLNHIDFDITNNHRWNLNLYHHNCNSSNKRSTLPPYSSLPERERKFVAGVRVGAGVEGDSELYPGWTKPWSSREGEKHDIQRARFNTWIRDMQHGPFQGPGGMIRLSALAKMAVHAIGMGSSITYRRYIEEDCFGPSPNDPGILELVDSDGIEFIRFRGVKTG